MITKENLTTGVIAGIVTAITLLAVSWAVAEFRHRRLMNQTPNQQPCGCGGH